MIYDHRGYAAATEIDLVDGLDSSKLADARLSCQRNDALGRSVGIFSIAECVPYPVLVWLTNVLKVHDAHSAEPVFN